MIQLTQKEIDLIVETMITVALENEKRFADLDAKCGDGDFGISLANGFRKIKEQWDSIDRSDIGVFLMKTGMIITSHVGGCSGPIWGTAFLKAGMLAKGKEAIGVEDLIGMSRLAIKGMMARGGASLGDKTLIDALAPATDALESYSKTNNKDLLAALREAAKTGHAQIESTRDWEAKRGRQSFTGKRSIGTLDPGVVAVGTMMMAVVEALEKAASKAVAP